MPDPKDIAICLGLLMIGVGVGAFDWRLGLITVGALGICGGVFGYIRKYGGRNGTS